MLVLVVPPEVANVTSHEEPNTLFMCGIRSFARVTRTSMRSHPFSNSGRVATPPYDVGMTGILDCDVLLLFKADFAWSQYYPNRATIIQIDVDPTRIGRRTPSRLPTVGRTDWQEEIATLCGTNIPLIAYWTALGQPIAQTPGEQGPVAWRASALHRLPPGALPPGAMIRDGYFRLADPLPGLYFYGIELPRWQQRSAKLIHLCIARLPSLKRCVDFSSKHPKQK